MSISMKEREEIFKAINNVSNKVNSVEQKLDEVIQILNASANEKISVNSGGIDGLASIVATHNEAIDDMAVIISELEER